MRHTITVSHRLGASVNRHRRRYTDDVIGILPKRNLNNGQSSLHAALIAAAAPQPGKHVLHIGVGYYTAILAELVGATGRVTAIEYDAELAARATGEFGADAA